MTSSQHHGVALVGAGHWGAKLGRNFADLAETDLRWVLDTDGRSAGSVARASGARVGSSLAEILSDDQVIAVAIATPASTHAELASACLRHDRHVLVEKPLASSVEAARDLAALATGRDAVLMVDHTYLFDAAAEQSRLMVAEGLLGEIRQIESVRSNTDARRLDVDVFWDLAHHDLSILGYVAPELTAVTVSATGTDELGIGHASAGTMTVAFDNEATLTAHLQWVGRTKSRRMRFSGTRGDLIWDDLAGQRRLVCVQGAETTVVALADHDEPLRGVVREFADSVAGRIRPRSDAAGELRVLAVLDAARRSLDRGGEPVPLAPVPTT
jgi:predicted dehydrogenase